jgi:hypothetical protein
VTRHAAHISSSTLPRPLLTSEAEEENNDEDDKDEEEENDGTLEAAARNGFEMDSFRKQFGQ